MIRSFSMLALLPAILAAQTLKVSSPASTVLPSDSVHGVTALAYDVRGYRSPRSAVTWAVRPAGAIVVAPDTATRGQLAAIAGRSPGVAYAVATWQRTDGAVLRDSLKFTVNAPQQPLSAGALYYDDFQSYTSAAQLTNGQSPIPKGAFFSTAKNGQISSIARPSFIFLDSTGGPNGTKAMRYDWPANGTGGTVQISPRINPAPLTSTIAVRWTDKVSANFTNGGQGCRGSACEYKWFLIKLGPPVAGTLSQIGVYLEGNEPNYRVTMDVTDRTNNINTTHAVSFPLPANWRDAWHTWVVTAENLGTANATFTLHYDGLPAIAISGPFLPGRTIGGPGQLVVLELGSNINNGPDHPQSRWWKEFGVYPSNPRLAPLIVK